MKCKICGREIAEGTEYCEECGKLASEQEIIHITKDDIKRFNKKEPRLKADGPFISIEGYAKSLLDNFTNIIALLGAVLMYLSPFLSWLKLDTGDETIKGSLFDIAGRNINDIIGLKQPVLALCCILFILSGITMLIFSARENIRPLRPFADNYLLRLTPLVFSVAAYIIVACNHAYRAALDNDMVGSGVGRVMGIAAMVLYVMSVALDKANFGDKR